MSIVQFPNCDHKKMNKSAFVDKMAEETGEMSLQLVSWYCWAAEQIYANNFVLDVKNDFPVEILAIVSTA